MKSIHASDSSRVQGVGLRMDIGTQRLFDLWTDVLKEALGLMPSTVHLFSNGITTVRIFQGFHSHCLKTTKNEEERKAK